MQHVLGGVCVRQWLPSAEEFLLCFSLMTVLEFGVLESLMLPKGEDRCHSRVLELEMK